MTAPRRMKSGCPYGCSSNDNVNTPCPHCDGQPDAMPSKRAGNGLAVAVPTGKNELGWAMLDA